MKYMHPESDEAKEAARLERLKVKLEERRRWWELRAVYERCVAIADQVWGERLDAAQMIQQGLAEEMRAPLFKPTDWPEGTPAIIDRSIPVPLFTPRDRQQFIKEVATTLLIETSRRGLNATPEPREETPGEAASGADEADLDTEAGEVAEQGSSPTV
jgi:hypothetical protein